MANRNVNIKIVEPQSEESKPSDLSQEEIDTYLYKYNRDLQKELVQQRKSQQKRSPKPHQKRVDGDSKTQKSNQEYYDTRYSEIDAGDEKVNFKIEIKSDMKL